VTLTASYQKIFSADPKLGFFAQASKFSAALEQGTVLAPAKNLAQMNTVVTNSLVDGVLSVLFASLIIIVIADAARVCYRTYRSPEPLPSTEAPFVESRILAPAGLTSGGDDRRETASSGTDRRRRREHRHAGAHRHVVPAGGQR